MNKNKNLKMMLTVIKYNSAIDRIADLVILRLKILYFNVFGIYFI